MSLIVYNGIIDVFPFFDTKKEMERGKIKEASKILNNMFHVGLLLTVLVKQYACYNKDLGQTSNCP